MSIDHNSINQALLSVSDAHDISIQKKDSENQGSRHISLASAYESETPINPAWLTTFLLVNTMIGSGILNQPYVFMESGLLGGILGFILASVMTWLGLIILCEAGVKANIFDYAELAKHAFGKKGETIVDYSIIIMAFGSMLGYMLVIGETVSSLIVSWGCKSVMCTPTSLMILTVGVFVTPVCMFRHFGHFAWLSLFSISAILAVLFLVIIGGPLRKESGPLTVIDISGTARSLGSIIFSLSCARY